MTTNDQELLSVAIANAKRALDEGERLPVPDNSGTFRMLIGPYTLSTLVQAAERSLLKCPRCEKLEAVLEDYACPADCSIARMKDGTCLAANMGELCGEAAREALATDSAPDPKEKG